MRIKHRLKTWLARPEKYTMSTFADVPLTELGVESLYAERPEGGWRSYAGIPVERKWADIFTVEVLLAYAQPQLVIELGTGTGGFSAFLATWCYQTGARFMTFDTHYKGSPTKRANYRALGLIRRLAGSYQSRDVFAARTVRKIGNQVRRPGVAFIYCDNGNKAKELRTYAPLLKPGDFIAVHDYGSEVFPADVEPILDRCEFWHEEFCVRSQSSNRFFRMRC